MRRGEAVGIPTSGESPHGECCIYGVRRLRSGLTNRAHTERGLDSRFHGYALEAFRIGLRSIIGQHMNSEELIFVTGATGFLGVQLVRELLARQPQARLALLIRDRAGQLGPATRGFDRSTSRAIASSGL